MKKLLSALLCLILLAGCTADVIPGRYNMLYEGDGEESGFLPSLHLSDDGSFTLLYDLLSSYMPHGSWHVQGDILTARTDDQRFVYRFRVADSDTLTFIADRSSDVTPIDTLSGFFPSITDGTKFRRLEDE